MARGSSRVDAGLLALNGQGVVDRLLTYDQLASDTGPSSCLIALRPGAVMRLRLLKPEIPRASAHHPH
jgi:hypothetical protein